MTTLSSSEILRAFDSGLERAARWPQLLKALRFAPRPEKPNAREINDALQALGFRRVLDERDNVAAFSGTFPDHAWEAIAQEVTGQDSATVERVVAGLQPSPRAAAE